MLQVVVPAIDTKCATAAATHEEVVGTIMIPVPAVERWAFGAMSQQVETLHFLAFRTRAAVFRRVSRVFVVILPIRDRILTDRTDRLFTLLILILILVLRVVIALFIKKPTRFTRFEDQVAAAFAIVTYLQARSHPIEIFSPFTTHRAQSTHALRA